MMAPLMTSSLAHLRDSLLDRTNLAIFPYLIVDTDGPTVDDNGAACPV